MSELFKRNWKVQVANLDVSQLHIEFRIVKTIKPEPNKCSLVVWNLSQDHRAQLQLRNNPTTGAKLVGIPVVVQAGYGNDLSTIFSGDLREVGSYREGLDWKTTISGDDGGRSYREGNIDIQFTKGTLVSTILQQCCNAMNIGLGNASSFFAGAQIGNQRSISHTFSASGSAAEALDRLIKSIGLTWSIQNGNLQILAKGVPLNQKAFLISSSTGLIGSPEASVDSTVSLGNPQQFSAAAMAKNPKTPKPKDPGILKIKTLIIPNMYPGRKITLDSAQYHGGYYLTEVLSIGQSFGQDWYHESVARLYT